MSHNHKDCFAICKVIDNGLLLACFLYHREHRAYPIITDESIMSDKSQTEQQKQALIEAVLQHVPFDGWSDQSLAMAGADCGYEAIEVKQLFPTVNDAISFYGQMADDAMMAAYQTHDALPERTHLKIRLLIEIRLTQAIPQKEAIRNTLKYLAAPQNAALASSLLYRTVDAMWRCAGDTSTDFSFYSKRATLAGIYSATLLAFLGDDNADMAKVMAFLDRRLADSAKIPKVTEPAKQVFGKVAGLASSLLAKGGARYR